MRFIIGFIFFGLLFYAIWLYFPEAFQILTSWAAAIFDFFKDVIEKITGKADSTTTPAPVTPKALLINFMHL